MNVLEIAQTKLEDPEVGLTPENRSYLSYKVKQTLGAIRESLASEAPYKVEEESLLKKLYESYS